MIQNKKADALISLLAMAVAMFGVIGWVTGQYWLTTWGGVVTMKLVSACTLAGMVICRQLGPQLFFVRLVIPFIMFYAIGSTCGEASVAKWFIEEPVLMATYSTSPGSPSWATVTLIVLGLLSIEVGFLRRVAVVVLIGCGLSCLIGHVFHQSLMFFYINDYSSAMAIPTGLIFLLDGIARLLSDDWANVTGAA